LFACGSYEANLGNPNAVVDSGIADANLPFFVRILHAKEGEPQRTHRFFRTLIAVNYR